MRLTKAIREDMVAAIMRDVPDGRKELFEAHKDKILQHFMDMLPNDAARDLYTAHPEIFERRRFGVYSGMVNRWQHLSDSFNANVEVPYNAYDADSQLDKVKWFVSFQKQLDEISEARKKAREEATKAVNSVNTAKRLREVYPDLAKYLPSDISGQALAVSQSLPNLHSAGWPKHATGEQVSESDQAET